MHYRRPDVQAEVLLDELGIGIEGPETSGSHGEVANIRMVEVPIVVDFVDGPFCCTIFHHKRSVELFTTDWPVLVVVACAFAFGASLLLPPLHERFLSRCDVDMSFDQLDQFRWQLVHMAADASPIAVTEA